VEEGSDGESGRIGRREDRMSGTGVRVGGREGGEGWGRSEGGKERRMRGGRKGLRWGGREGGGR